MRLKLRLLLLCGLAILCLTPIRTGHLQDDITAEVERLFNRMTVEERVGQLFLVTFYGTDLSTESEIYSLISEYQVGGVVLSAERDNFTDQDDIITSTQTLIAELQALNEAASTPGITFTRGAYVPLFIGIEYEPGQADYRQFVTGLEPLPSSMAMGATWQPDYAEAVGEVVGRQIAGLGFNLLIGPSADVLQQPQLRDQNSLGTRAFGGEPYWTSQMVSRYVAGVHQGSQNRLAVVPRHFPGYGGADRLAAAEIPTVRRTLDQLAQSDLQPFYAVTGDALTPAMQADGLLTAHIRYLGFQGDNPRQPTRPISLDAQALSVLQQLEPIQTWHEAGGLLISDSLGYVGVQRFYDPRGQTFPHRQIAQNAFAAGNDVLYLGEFGLDPGAQQYSNTTDLITFFVQRYGEDPAFQARVDASVQRILYKKISLYGGPADLEDVLPADDAFPEVEEPGQLTQQVARTGLTLLSPSQQDILTAPQSGEQIVVFTDARQVQQCSTCEAQFLLEPAAFEAAVLRQYGPQAVGILRPEDIQSFTFDELAFYLTFGTDGTAGDGTAEPVAIPAALQNAEWVVFLPLEADEGSSGPLEQFLAQVPVDPQTNIVVMSLGAPYPLDATEVSKLAGYYAVYGFSQPFIDAAGSALLQDFAFEGRPPITVPNIAYDVLEATQPDAGQRIALNITIVRGTSETILSPSQDFILEQADTLQMETGVITDTNGNPVPDGTPVEFTIEFLNERLIERIQTTTQGGVASASYLVTRNSDLLISATSPPATTSDTIQFTAAGVVFPAAPPTPAPESAPPAEIVTDDSAPSGDSLPTVPDGTAPVDATFGELFFSVVGLLLLGAAVFLMRMGRSDINQGLLYALPAVVLGLVFYNFYALSLPGTQNLYRWLGSPWAASLFTWAGGLLGYGITHLLVNARNNELRSLRRR